MGMLHDAEDASEQRDLSAFRSSARCATRSTGGPSSWPGRLLHAAVPLASVVTCDGTRGGTIACLAQVVSGEQAGCLVRSRGTDFCHAAAKEQGPARSPAS